MDTNSRREPSLDLPRKPERGSWRAHAVSCATGRLAADAMTGVAACQFDGRTMRAVCFQNKGQSGSRSDFPRQPRRGDCGLDT